MIKFLQIIIDGGLVGLVYGLELTSDAVGPTAITGSAAQRQAAADAVRALPTSRVRDGCRALCSGSCGRNLRLEVTARTVRDH